MLSDHPLPWTEEKEGYAGGVIRDANRRIVIFVQENELRVRIVLWANAEEVQMRRGWNTTRWDNPKDTWGVVTFRGDCPRELLGYCRNAWPDPATALVKADEWLKENVEGKP